MLSRLSAADYLELIRIGIMNIRRLASEEGSEGCLIEAYHIHNLPHVLSSKNADAERYYWEAERTGYLQQARAGCAEAFQEVWSRARG